MIKNGEYFHILNNLSSKYAVFKRGKITFQCSSVEAVVLKNDVPRHHSILAHCTQEVYPACNVPNNRGRAWHNQENSGH